MDLTPFDYVVYYISEVVLFFSRMFNMFPSLIMSMLFFIPAMVFVFIIIHYFRDMFKG